MVADDLLWPWLSWRHFRDAVRKLHCVVGIEKHAKMTMVDRVATAIEAAWVDAANPKPSLFNASYDTKVLARAAIEAMRVPDERMLNAVGAVATKFWLQTWGRMIDAALAQPDSDGPVV